MLCPCRKTSLTSRIQFDQCSFKQACLLLSHFPQVTSKWTARKYRLESLSASVENSLFPFQCARHCHDSRAHTHPHTHHLSTLSHPHNALLIIMVAERTHAHTHTNTHHLSTMKTPTMHCLQQEQPHGACNSFQGSLARSAWTISESTGHMQ